MILTIIVVLLYIIQIPLTWIRILYVKKKDEELWSIFDFFKLFFFSLIPILNLAGICLLIEEGAFSWFTKKRF